MKGIELRNRDGQFKAYCPECWTELPITDDPTKPESYNHQCDGKRDITVLRMELEQYEESEFKEIHPIDYLESKGLEVMSYEGDQADYCVYISVRGQTVPELPPFFSVSDHVPTDHALM